MEEINKSKFESLLEAVIEELITVNKNHQALNDLENNSQFSQDFLNELREDFLDLAQELAADEVYLSHQIELENLFKQPITQESQEKFQELLPYSIKFIRSRKRHNN